MQVLGSSCVSFHFEELDFHSASPEEWKQLLVKTARYVMCMDNAFLQK